MGAKLKSDGLKYPERPRLF